MFFVVFVLHGSLILIVCVVFFCTCWLCYSICMICASILVLHLIIVFFIVRVLVYWLMLYVFVRLVACASGCIWVGACFVLLFGCLLVRWFVRLIAWLCICVVSSLFVCLFVCVCLFVFLLARFCGCSSACIFFIVFVFHGSLRCSVFLFNRYCVLCVVVASYVCF